MQYGAIVARKPTL